MISNVLIAAVLAAVASVRAAIGAADQYYGDATYYYPEGGLGACGTPLQNTDSIVALSPAEYADGANCFRHIGVNYQGLFVDATVGDLCPECLAGSIDLSPVAFEQLSILDAGRIQVEWDFQ